MAIFLFGFCLLCNFMNFIVILFFIIIFVSDNLSPLSYFVRAGLVKYPLCYRGVNAKPIQIDRRN